MTASFASNRWPIRSTRRPARSADAPALCRLSQTDLAANDGCHRHQTVLTAARNCASAGTVSRSIGASARSAWAGNGVRGRRKGIGSLPFEAIGVPGAPCAGVGSAREPCGSDEVRPISMARSVFSRPVIGRRFPRRSGHVARRCFFSSLLFSRSEAPSPFRPIAGRRSASSSRPRPSIPSAGSTFPTTRPSSTLPSSAIGPADTEPMSSPRRSRS